MSKQALTDYARMLDEVEREYRWVNQRPRNAATLILIDRTGAVPQVLLGRRHPGHKFLPDKFVFPGGRAEPLDRRMPILRPLDERVARRLMDHCVRPSAIKANALALAAIRETAEETGLILGKKQSEPVATPGGAWAPFAEAGVLPDLGGLQFIARAITPPRRPKRFDTRFFVADASEIAHRIEGVVGPHTELVELVWMPIAEAVRLDLTAITHVVLNELEARTAAGLTHDPPVPFYKMIHGHFRRIDLD